jgi:hypothetical protein
MAHIQVFGRGEIVGFAAITPGEVQSISIPDPSSLAPETTERLANPGEHYLLTIETAKGYWLDIEIPGDFDPTKLAVEVIEWVLPDDDQVRFSELSYDGVSEIGDSTGKGDYHYVTFPDGRCREVAIVDDSSVH